MLQEIRAMRQDPGGPARRWFQDEYFDLFVTMGADGGIAEFQLCYDRSGIERVLGWSSGNGLFHRRIDAGEAAPMQKETPIATADAPFFAFRTATEFGNRTAELDGRIRTFVLEKIAEAGRQFGRRHGHGRAPGRR